MGVFDNLKIPSYGDKPAEPTKDVFSSVKVPTQQPATKPSVFSNVKIPTYNQAETTPYFYGVTAEGGTIGHSEERDVSGKPFLAYRNPGDTSTTTDRTRIATTFDPRTAAPATRDSFYNPRAVDLRNKMRDEFGIAYSDELDHKIALALAGSNDKENLRAVDKKQNNDANLISKLQKEVIEGKISLEDAQIKLAQQKGLPIPKTFQRPLTDNILEYSREVRVPKGAKPGDTFKGPDGKTYTVQAPKVEDLGKALYESMEGPQKLVAVPQATAHTTSQQEEGENAWITVARDLSNPKILKDTVTGLPQAFADIVGKPQLRAYGAVGSYIAKRLGLAEKDFTPEGKFLTDLYGTDKPLSLSGIGRETRGGDLEGESKGFFKLLDPTVGFLVGSLDAVDGGILGRLSRTLTLSRTTKEIIAASKSVDEIASALRKEIPIISEGLAQALAKPLVYVDDLNTVESVLNRTKVELQNLEKSKATAEEMRKVPKELEGSVTPVKPKTAQPVVFKGYDDLSTVTLEKLAGRSTVSKQFIQDLTNSPDMKQVERDLIREKLAEYPDGDIPVKEFADKVKAELLPLNRETGSLSEGYTPRYENISLPEDIKGSVANYSENVYNSPIKTSAGQVHFGDRTDSYFGHTRVEDMKDGTRRVIEVQSDLYQKGRLEDSVPFQTKTLPNEAKRLEEIQSELYKIGDNTSQKAKRLNAEKAEIRKVIDSRPDPKATNLQKLRQYNDPTAHFRMIREEVKQAAIDGKTKLQFPTGETAMKIEGLGNAEQFNLMVRGEEVGDKLTKDNMRIGQAIFSGDVHDTLEGSTNMWIITEVLEDGKFRAMPHGVVGNMEDELIKFGSSPDDAIEALRSGDKEAQEIFSGNSLNETFDISGKVDTNNPIYKFYEKEVGRYLKNRYNAQIVTDAQGVKWHEVNITPELATKPVTAFKYKPLTSGPKAKVSKISKDIEALIKEFRPEGKYSLIFDKDLLKRTGSIGNVTSYRELLSGRLRQVINLYEKGGKVPARVAFHETWHYFENTMSSKMLEELRKETFSMMSKSDIRYYEGLGYKGDEIASEFMADEWGKKMADRFGYKSKIQKVLDLINAFIQKIIDTAKAIYKRYKATPGKQGGYAKNPFASEPDEIRPNFRETEAGNKELAKQLKKEAPPATFKIDKQIAELGQQKVALAERLKNDPARELNRLFGRSSDTLSQQLENAKATDKATLIQDKITELGFANTEAAQQALDAFKYDAARFKGISTELSDLRTQRANFVKEDKDAKSMNQLLNKEARQTALDVAREERKANIKKAMDEAAEKIAKESAYEAEFNRKVEEAYTQAKQGKGIIAKIRQALNPIKGLDSQTKQLFVDWFTKKEVAKQLGQEAFDTARNAGPQNFQEILDYQAGKKTPYIKEGFDSMQTEFKRRGLDISYIEDYIPQVWDNTEKQFSDAAKSYLKKKGLSDKEIEAYMNGVPLPEAKALRLKLRPNFTKARFWPDYKTGMAHGLRPKYYTPSQLFAHYRESGEVAIANRELISKLKQEAKLLPGDNPPVGWKPVTLRFAREGYYASPELADLINGQFRDESDLTVNELIHKGGAWLSATWQTLKLSAGVPFTSINYFSIGQAVKLLTTAVGETSTLKFKRALSSLKASFALIRANSNKASAAWFYENRAYVMALARQGIDVTGNVGSYKNLYRSFKNMGMKDKFGTAFSKAVDEKTFKSMMPQITVQIFKDTYLEAIRAGLEPEMAEQYAAKVIETYGGLIKEVGRSVTTQQTLGTYFFAPRFRETLINTYLSVIKGFSTEFRNPAYSKSRSLLVGMAITYVLYNLLNRELNDGDNIWDNPPGREFQLRIPLQNGLVVYSDFMPSFLAMPRAIGTGILAGAKGDISVVLQKAGSFFSMPVKTFSEILSNRDYFGDEIVKDTDTTKQKIKKWATYIGVAANHPFIAESYKYWTGQRPLYQALIYMMELPAKFSTYEKDVKSRFYTAQEAKKKEQAREKERVQEIYDRLQVLKSEGKVEEANSIYDALPEGDQKIYDSIKSSEKRSNTLKRKPIIQDIYDKNQILIRDGRQEEAEAIYTNLTPEDQRIYDSIKKAAQ